MSKTKYRSVSLPTGLTDEVEKLIEEFGFWTSVGAFVREATVKQVKAWQDRLKDEPPEAIVPPVEETRR